LNPTNLYHTDGDLQRHNLNCTGNFMANLYLYSFPETNGDGVDVPWDCKLI